MRDRVARLRIWLLGSAVFLALVIAAFLVSAHYLAHRRWTLPAGLGVNIVRETNSWNYCQTVKGRTVYCIHAAQSVEHKDGKITLHDVSIDLYGEKQNLNDRIYGDEFEYDKKAELMRAMGVVHLDLQAAGTGGRQAGDSAANPAANTGTGRAAERATQSGAPQQQTGGAKVVHVTTSGLIYMAKLGIAATSDSIEFQAGGMTGHATGADYSSDSGILTLHSSVSMSGTQGKRPVTVTAATAELDNRNQVAYLTQARYVSPGQTVDAERATLHARPDGTLSRVEAQGNVTMEANGATAISQQADVELGAKGQPESAVLAGGVRYSSSKPLVQRNGQADEARIAFDAQGRAKNAVFTGAVQMDDRTRASEAANEPWSTHNLTAAKVEILFVPAGPHRSQPQDADATGNAHMTVVDQKSPASERGAGTTELSADDLKAHWSDAAGAKEPPQLETVAGRGHTALRQLGVNGLDETSTGDELEASFRSRGASSAALSMTGARPVGVAAVRATPTSAGGLMSGTGLDDLRSAVQQGHVAITRRAPANSGSQPAGTTVTAGAKINGLTSEQADVEHATAQRAAYDGVRDRLTLTGGVQLSDAGSVLWAEQVAFDRKTGDAQATGAVKVEYASAPTTPLASEITRTNGAHGGLPRGTPSGPTHILAERAELVHASGEAMFYGSPARMWQDGSQVEAPVIEILQAEQRLIARGGTSTGGTVVPQTAQVHTVLASAESGPSGAAKAGAGERLPKVMRIASGELVYSGALHQAEFSGGVRAETVDGTIRADQATVNLQPAAEAGQAASATVPVSVWDAVPSLAGSVERMVATGQIEITQPGRRATGGRLVYTASDRLFVLTGDGKTQPKLLDATRGTITGAALQFHSGDDSVVVTNAGPGALAAAAEQRMQTEAQGSNKEAAADKGKQ